MKPISDQQLDALLQQAYPKVDVSPDFTLRLWRKLMQEPPVWWKVPAPVLALAAVFGMIGGLVTASAMAHGTSLERLDLFGNGPHDSLAGAVLDLMGRDAA